VVIKFFEGLSTYILKDLIAGEFRRNLRGKLAYLLLKPGVARIREQFDYEVVGASPLLGVRGMLLITHGSARRRMIWYAVETAAIAVRGQVTQQIAESLGMTDQAGASSAADDALDTARSDD
jgi:glycerol-3-phosphate acyltransferase PlsX